MSQTNRTSRTRPTLRAHGGRAAVAVTLACALTAAVQQPTSAEPSTLAEVQAELRRLYHDAEVATEEYNAVDEKVTKQEKRVRSLNSQVKVAERKLSRLTSLAGAAARAQYRSGGLPAEVQFALASDPENALDNASLARRAHQSTQAVLTALTDTHEDLRTRKDDASEELDSLRANRRAMATESKKIEKNIAAARKVESRLEEEQRRELAELEERKGEEAQAEWERTGILDQVGTEATPAGRKAIAYATRQLGKPYVWGAEGPESFDCSGLTSAAWLHAGVVIPRTSQEQWRQLQRVPVEDMRPGDLIIYRSDASHVALYIGDGEVIQAPRPGRSVYVSPAASMEILGAVRPDA